MSDHYFTKKPSSALKLQEVEFVARGFHIKCQTGSGTFSIKQLDTGTEALLKYAIIRDDWRVLDLGCGWGPVGITCAKMGCVVTMTDINSRAIKLSRMNVKSNNVQATFCCGDRFEKVEGFFDCILLNPPQTAGRDICYMMIDEALDYLVTGGVLQIVARAKKGGKMLSQRMEERFGNVKVLGKQSGFTVYLSKKMDDTPMQE